MDVPGDDAGVAPGDDAEGATRDDTGDVMDTRLLSYAELGEALGITAASAKRLANRRKWAKAIGNDGLSRVHVPVERLEAAKKVARDASGAVPEDDAGDAPDDVAGDDTGDVGADARALIAVLEERAAELKARVEVLEQDNREGRAAIAELGAKAARVDLLEAVLEVERRRGEELKAERDRLLERALEPEPAGLLARLRRALR